MNATDKCDVCGHVFPRGEHGIVICPPANVLAANTDMRSRYVACWECFVRAFGFRVGSRR